MIAYNSNVQSLTYNLAYYVTRFGSSAEFNRSQYPSCNAMRCHVEYLQVPAIPLKLREYTFNYRGFDIMAEDILYIYIYIYIYT